MSVVYKMNDVISLSNDFDDKFSALINLKKNEKLIIVDKKLYLDTNMMIFQPLTRWWNNYNRNDTVVFIEQEMDTYLDFVKFIRNAYNNSRVYSQRWYDLYDIYNKHMELISKYIDGITALQVTYQDNKEIVEELKSICKKLNQMPKLNDAPKLN